MTCRGSHGPARRAADGSRKSRAARKTAEAAKVELHKGEETLGPGGDDWLLNNASDLTRPGGPSPPASGAPSASLSAAGTRCARRWRAALACTRQARTRHQRAVAVPLDVRLEALEWI